MLRDLRFTYRHYVQDLQLYMDLMFELNGSLMFPGKRRELEYTKTILEVVLEMYELDYR